MEDVREVINTPFEVVNSTSLVLKLLNSYSKLYLNGAQPGGCSLCIRDYYNKLLRTGMDLALKYEEAKNRTCKPAWNGLKYIPSTARHWNSELITDSDAKYLLSESHLKESDFEILPSILIFQKEATSDHLDTTMDKPVINKSPIKQRKRRY
jgi:hypothetical protein